MNLTDWTLASLLFLHSLFKVRAHPELSVDSPIAWVCFLNYCSSAIPEKNSISSNSTLSQLTSLFRLTNAKTTRWKFNENLNVYIISNWLKYSMKRKNGNFTEEKPGRHHFKWSRVNITSSEINRHHASPEKGKHLWGSFWKYISWLSSWGNIRWSQWRDIVQNDLYSSKMIRPWNWRLRNCSKLETKET